MTETKAAGTGGAGERSRAEQPATTGEETTSAGGIAAKLLAAARAVGNVEKSGRNARHGYDYVTIDDVVRAARTALLAQGLLVHSEITAIDEREIRSQNSSGLLIRLETRWRVLDAETGETSVHPWTSYGSDYPGDKALYKALSGARKYFLIDLLQIAVGDDPEAEDPVPAAGTPAMVAVGDGDGASAEPARGALVALTGGPAADRGSAGPTPAASKRFDRAIRAS